jgi:uncharacterized protein (TIGR03067 family)
MRGCLLLCLTAALAVAADKPKPDVKAELAKLQGTWRATAAEEDGRPLPADDVRGWTLTIEGAKYTFRPGEGEAVQGTYTLNPLQNPGAIDATRTSGDDKGKALWGVYRVEGDELRICFNKPGEQVRPKAFKTGADGPGHRLYVFKRATKKPPPRDE